MKPFDGKHVIVAACAAIAMFLGAISAGASMLTNHEEPTATKAEVSSIVSANPDSADAASENGTGLTRQHMLEGRSLNTTPSGPINNAAPQAKSLKNTIANVFSKTSPLLLIGPSQLLENTAASTTKPTTETGTTPNTNTQTPSTEEKPATETPVTTEPETPPSTEPPTNSDNTTDTPLFLQRANEEVATP